MEKSTVTSMDKQSFEKVLPNIYTLSPTTLPNQSTDMDYKNEKVAEPVLEATPTQQTDNDAENHDNLHVDLAADTNTLGSTPDSMNINISLSKQKPFETKDITNIHEKTTTLQLQQYISSLKLKQMSKIQSGARMTRIALEIAATTGDLQHPSNIKEHQIGYSNYYTFGPNTMVHIQSKWKMTHDKKWIEINLSKDATQWENTTYWEQNDIGKWQCRRQNSSS